MYSAGTISCADDCGVVDLRVGPGCVRCSRDSGAARRSTEPSCCCAIVASSFGLQFGGFLSVVLTLAGTRIETGGKVWDLSTSVASTRHHERLDPVAGGAAIRGQQYQARQGDASGGRRRKPAARRWGSMSMALIAATFALGEELCGAARCTVRHRIQTGAPPDGHYPRSEGVRGCGGGRHQGASLAHSLGLSLWVRQVLAAGFISTPMRTPLRFRC